MTTSIKNEQTNIKHRVLELLIERNGTSFERWHKIQCNSANNKKVGKYGFLMMTFQLDYKDAICL